MFPQKERRFEFLANKAYEQYMADGEPLTGAERREFDALTDELREEEEERESDRRYRIGMAEVYGPGEPVWDACGFL